VTAVDELITFLRAQLDDDERVAREAIAVVGDAEWLPGGRLGDGSVRGSTLARVADYAVPPEHIASWDPARVLAEVEAKRRVLDYLIEAAKGDVYGMKTSIALLAQPYAGREGWRTEWELDAGQII